MTIDQTQLALALRHAVEEDLGEVVAILAKHVDRSLCDIDDGDECAKDDGDGQLVVFSVHTLKLDGVEVCDWNRIAIGRYCDGTWLVEADLVDKLPDNVEPLLRMLDLTDSLPDVPEPTPSDAE